MGSLVRKPVRSSVKRPSEWKRVFRQEEKKTNVRKNTLKWLAEEGKITPDIHLPEFVKRKAQLTRMGFDVLENIRPPTRKWSFPLIVLRKK